ncbi:MAG: outer membrane beta-barrel protein [Rhodospirillales bacterium]|nr:MAG: outer membrane beta-barrel protein [Rhodospirillales bacterium]
MPRFQACLGALALVASFAVSQTADAQRVSAEAAPFRVAAEEGGPGALLEALDGVLRRRPELAGTPETAANLARDAAVAVRFLRGANLPVYRAIIDRIVAAAPPANRDAVARAVTAAVGQTASVDPRTQTRLPPGTVVEGPQERLVVANAEAERERASRLGFDAGGFRIFPTVDAAVVYDDNVYATKRGKRGDIVGVAALALVGENRGSSHSAVVQGHVDVSRYRQYNRENALDFWFSAEGTYDLGPSTSLFGGVLGKRDHEDRDSPDAVNGIEPTIYWEQRAYAGIAHRSGAWRFRFGSTYRHLDFDDADSLAGRINNSDRSRSHLETGFRVGYVFSPSFQLFGQLAHDLRNYDGYRDDNGFRRNSQGFVTGMGARFTVSPKLDGEVFAGFMYQNYRDSRFSTVGTPALQGSVRWRPVAGTLVVGWFDRSIEETTSFGSPAYVLSSVGARLEQDITRDLALTLRAGYARSDFQDSGRRDHDYDASVGLKYGINENYYVGADYRFQARRSNLGAAEYDRSQVFLRVGAQY